MDGQEELKNRIETIEKELHRGWSIYGKYMDGQRTHEKEAVEVRAIIKSLTEEKSAILMLISPNEAVEYIAQHKERVDAIGR